MDALAELLDEVRARGALITQSNMASPWSLRFASGAPLTLVSMLRGHAWIVLADAGPVPIGAGDIAIIRGPAPYTVSDDPSVPPDQVITSADYCARSARTLAGEGLAPTPRTCGVAEDAAAVLLSGAYDARDGISDHLLDALPDVLVVPERHSPGLNLVAEEVARDRPGQQAVLDRLLDLTLVSALRAWFDQPRAHAPAWYRSTGGSIVSQALRLLHDDPARPWTVADLAAEAGVSRALFARRFAEQVGQSPMAYLTSLRIALAADRLRDTGATVGAIAREVGYANAFALSVAFKRLRGITPSEHRATFTPQARRTG
ncbi:AraC family transcriptional regulator [Nonomuraea sp. NPDC000554]|uniref:AraC family transcriptional regulator n=1 Tax=Nonomuraea sp. NPDC000554 TaxID=3154259 RepID=UPI00331FD37F